VQLPGIRYEAEANQNILGGSAITLPCPGCSGGRQVGGLSAGGTLAFTGVQAAAAGPVTIQIAYCSYDTPVRSLLLRANEGPPIHLDFSETGGWTTVGTLATSVMLKPGDNTLLFSIDGPAPNIDAITVVVTTLQPTAPPVTSSPSSGQGKTSSSPAGAPAAPSLPRSPSPSRPPSPVSYEAEASNNTRKNATIAPCVVCSGGKKVRDIGNDTGTLQFNGVNWGTTGTILLVISYVNGDVSRSGQLSVNAGPAITVEFPNSGSWTTVRTVTIPITVRAGSNSLLFFNDTGWAPDLDMITLRSP
jgi:hypothetical protein